MRKIGLLSDTHGYLDPSVFQYFQDCDEVWHAGDIGSVEIIEQLSKFKPLKAVFGNIDDQAVRQLCPEHQQFQCEQVDVWITHIGGYPGRYSSLVSRELKANPPALFIAGHSHIVKVQYDKNLKLLHLNPGAVGKQGWHTVRTLMRFEINGDRIENLELIELGKR
ncbi:MAG TPA: metallophosphatase family protein [Candidatus Sphingobacterium stercoripullorum]|uniref:Phosphoesterase n=1 Tax=Candidatus Sphingobacterium stercoripullorum TaxID=2838759 RepID=A0A9D1W8N0_9SPHI|nr:metallophosphatase family protein [Candidatus Sphingobacterium stercoripullorum]